MHRHLHPDTALSRRAHTHVWPCAHPSHIRKCSHPHTCVLTHSHTHLHKHLYKCAYPQTSVHIPRTSICVCAQTCLHMHLHVCTDVLALAFARVHRHAHTQIPYLYTHTCTDACVLPQHLHSSPRMSTCTHVHTHAAGAQRPLLCPHHAVPSPGTASALGRAVLVLVCAAGCEQHCNRSIAVAAALCRAAERCSGAAAWGALGAPRAALGAGDECAGGGGSSARCSMRGAATLYHTFGCRAGATLWFPPQPGSAAHPLAPLLCNPHLFSAPMGARRVSVARTPPTVYLWVRGEPGLNPPQPGGQGRGISPHLGSLQSCCPAAPGAIAGSGGSVQHRPPWALSPARPFSSSQTSLQSLAPALLWQSSAFAQKYRSGQGAGVAEPLPRLQCAGTWPRCPGSICSSLRCLAVPRSSQQTPVCMGCDGEKKKQPLMLVFLQQKFQLEMLRLPWGWKNPIQGGGYGMKRSRETIEGLWGAAGLMASRGQHHVPVFIPVKP